MDEQKYWQVRLSDESWYRIQNAQILLDYQTTPMRLYKPKLSLDGNEYCFLYGDNLQDGVCGFGKSPELARIDFDKNWYKELNK